MKRIPVSLYSFAALLFAFMSMISFDGNSFVDGISPLFDTTEDAVQRIDIPALAGAETLPLLKGDKPVALRAPVGVGNLHAFGPMSHLTDSPYTTRQEANSLILPDIKRLAPLPPTMLRSIDSETLWLARVIYSETKQPEEQELIAWVVRNRVETGYRGKRTYRDTVLDRLQFSAFNPGSSKRNYYSRLKPSSKAPGWQRALRIAHEVRQMPLTLRPFSSTTRHFYSERSMRGKKHPTWAKGKRPVTPRRPFALDAKRFRFFENIG
ncbi:MAG TPA: hypothetical protein VKP65_08055 [Rhodothermales bacterium]|nr:hypothetical protein [Rhodothermales bacterium]